MGHEIENRQDREFLPHERDNAEGLLREGHRLPVLHSLVRTGPSALYNCHGMTFASRRTAIHSEVAVELILQDDGYREIRQSNALPGDVVLYYEQSGRNRSLTHSGVIVGVERIGSIITLRVVSKWGSGGEYVHDLSVHPYPTSTIHRFFRAAWVSPATGQD